MGNYKVVTIHGYILKSESIYKCSSLSTSVHTPDPKNTKRNAICTPLSCICRAKVLHAKVGADSFEFDTLLPRAKRIKLTTTALVVCSASYCVGYCKNLLAKKCEDCPLFRPTCKLRRCAHRPGFGSLSKLYTLYKI